MVEARQVAAEALIAGHGSSGHGGANGFSQNDPRTSMVPLRVVATSAVHGRHKPEEIQLSLGFQ